MIFSNNQNLDLVFKDMTRGLYFPTIPFSFFFGETTIPLSCALIIIKIYITCRYRIQIWFVFQSFTLFFFFFLSKRKLGNKWGITK